MGRAQTADSAVKTTAEPAGVLAQTTVGDASSVDLQNSSSSDRQGGQQVPDAPQPQGQTQSAPKKPPSQGSAQDERQPQTNRILDIIPNFRAVSTDEQLPPQSVKEKFIDTTKDSFDYSAVFIPLMLAGYGMARNSTPEFGDGGPAFARYFWHAAVDQTSENYMVEFIVPSITHEDTRYYTLGRGGFWKRTAYSLSRAVITRNDKGKDEFNISEVVGAGAASGISSLYYPSKERSLGSVGTEWGLDVAIDSLSFVVKEFWPDVNHALFHKDGH